MFVGPVFSRELVTAPRRPRLFVLRALYPAVLLLISCTAWLVLTGTQVILNVGDMARFGSILFQNVLAPLQLALISFFSAMLTASAVAQEKDRKTLILLLMTRLNNCELVLGKLFSSLLNVVVMLLAGLPIFMLIVLFGGTSFNQVLQVFSVTLVTALAAGSLGSLYALWREKTFQALALTALTLVFWVGLWEAVGSSNLGEALFGIPSRVIAAAMSPLTAVAESAKPTIDRDAIPFFGSAANLYIAITFVLTVLMNLVAILRVRYWNPSREVRRGNREQESAQSIWGVEHDLASESTAEEDARSGHVDSKLRDREKQPSRRVWDNPILWREICTWAYGKKIIAIRIAYLALTAFAFFALYWLTVVSPPEDGAGFGAILQAASRPMIPFFLVSLVIINALAATTITNERDGRSLDLLLVTDLSPREFMAGKLGGVFWVTKEMVLLPIVLCVYLWWTGGLKTEDLVFLIGGLLVMDVFVAVLGIHCGMTYANSRRAIGVSLGTVFFLFLGVVACILLMISFSGAFQMQLPPFLAFIVGGGVGIYVALGSRNPSPAIGAASILLPFATFYAIVSFLMEFNIAAFIVVALTYGFTTASMVIPALHEFDFAMGRTPADEE